MLIARDPTRKWAVPASRMLLKRAEYFCIALNVLSCQAYLRKSTCPTTWFAHFWHPAHQCSVWFVSIVRTIDECNSEGGWATKAANRNTYTWLRYPIRCKSDSEVSHRMVDLPCGVIQVTLWLENIAHTPVRTSGKSAAYRMGMSRIIQYIHSFMHQKPVRCRASRGFEIMPWGGNFCRCPQDPFRRSAHNPSGLRFSWWPG